MCIRQEQMVLSNAFFFYIQKAHIITCAGCALLILVMDYKMTSLWKNKPTKECTCAVRLQQLSQGLALGSQFAPEHRLQGPVPCLQLHQSWVWKINKHKVSGSTVLDSAEHFFLQGSVVTK